MFQQLVAATASGPSAYLQRLTNNNNNVCIRHTHNTHLVILNPIAALWLATAALNTKLFALEPAKKPFSSRLPQIYICYNFT
jgi:hypothetical protein